MKLLIFLLMFPMSVFAASACEVYGISDSPQKLNCYMHDGSLIEKLDVYCKKGNYQLSWKGKLHEVQTAYHEEVEEGSSPLVFVTPNMTLTTVSFQFYSRADLVIAERTIMGLCFDK